MKEAGTKPPTNTSDSVTSPDIGKSGNIKGGFKSYKGTQVPFMPSSYETSSKRSEKSGGVTHSTNKNVRQWPGLPKKPARDAG